MRDRLRKVEKGKKEREEEKEKRERSRRIIHLTKRERVEVG